MDFWENKIWKEKEIYRILYSKLKLFVKNSFMSKAISDVVLNNDLTWICKQIFGLDPLEMLLLSQPPENVLMAPVNMGGRP